MEYLLIAITAASLVMFLVMNRQLDSYKKKQTFLEEALMGMSSQVTFSAYVNAVQEMEKMTEEERNNLSEGFRSIFPEMLTAILKGGVVFKLNSGYYPTESNSVH